MKITKLFNLSFFFLSFLTTNLFSQSTQEEYNYVAKGYKVQIESGLDMKKGYTLVDMGSWGLDHNPEHRECTFKGLLRQGQTKPCAIMMIYKRTDVANGANFYVCIPTLEAADLWQQTLDFIKQKLPGK
jgi:hypothetical protein